jgi:hypothetical protein
MRYTPLTLGLIIAMGIAFRRLSGGGGASNTVRHSINLCVFNVFLPALCLKIFYTAGVDAEALLVPLTAALTIGASLAAAFLVYVPLSRLMRIDDGMKGNPSTGSGCIYPISSCLCSRYPVSSVRRHEPPFGPL